MFLCLFAIPLFYYGKCTRAWTDDKEFMKYLYVRKDEDDDAIVDDENGKGINNGDNPNSQNPTSDLDTGNVLSNINKFDFANDDNNLPKKNDSSDESPREDEVDLGEKSPNSESNITHPAAETTRDSEK
ncbi:unnamed protein product [[Candida] boidinii]|nr:unnamed protein product [[Candida] boidinii]